MDGKTLETSFFFGYVTFSSSSHVLLLSWSFHGRITSHSYVEQSFFFFTTEVTVIVVNRKLRMYITCIKHFVSILLIS